jgi:hypothetical protein
MTWGCDLGCRLGRNPVPTPRSPGHFACRHDDRDLEVFRQVDASRFLRPVTAIINSQSVKGAETVSRATRGYDGGECRMPVEGSSNGHGYVTPAAGA